MLTFAGREMRINVPGYGDMTTDVAIALADLRRTEHEMDMAFAAARQAYIAKHCGTVSPLMEHGQLVAQIDAAVFADWEKREGKGFFADKSCRRDFLKRHPECAVRGIPRRTTLRMPGRGGRWASNPAPALSSQPSTSNSP